MTNRVLPIWAKGKIVLLLALAVVLIGKLQVGAQCPAIELASGLRLPLGITQSNQDNLIVSETGTRTSNTGRISVIDLTGNRRTLVDGLPSGINDVNEPAGPAGVVMRGRTLYVAIGVGDVAIAGPSQGTAVPNPNPPSSPLFSSVLAIHFSASVENTTAGFLLSLEDHQLLATGQKISLTNGAGDQITIQMLANFTDYTPNPLPLVPANVRLSNPFDLVVIDDQLYVTDGGQNIVRRVDIPTSTVTTLASFAPVMNPFFPFLGGPVIEAVPTGIRVVGGHLLVNLFSGVPFAPGFSRVQAVDPVTGVQTTFIGGRKTAIDVLSLEDGDDTDYVVLQHASVGLFFGSPGVLLRFETPADSPTTIANCLTRPTSMVLDEKTGTFYVSEFGGRVVGLPLAP